MTFAIYSTGDSAFLEQVLISVAMVTGSGSITAIASIGLLIGILIMGFSSVMEGGKAIPFEQFLVGWLLYACAFYPTTTVVIEDNYTGSVRPVANVPLGVAVSGFVVSSIGYKLTDLFEQGYGFIAPSVTTTHFAEPLKILNQLRSSARNAAVMDAMNLAATNGGDLRKSWDNYIRECTITAIDLGQRSLNDILKMPLPQALYFESRTFGTWLYLNNAIGKDYTCTEGYSELVSVTKSATQSPLVDHVLKGLLIENAGETYDTAESKIQSSLDMLGAVSDDAYTYMLGVILEPIYEDAAIGRYQDIQDVGSAVMLNQAIQQRNTQWASEQSLFMTVVRPMQTFFEGFVYAVTPMLAILLVMGKFGIGLAGKYLQTIFWIQLWLPVLSIINLYITTAASGQMSSYLSGNELTSMYSISSIDSILETWIAAGGMLAAATPVITFFLITGSAYAFTSIAGKLGGADHTNEKMLSPDASTNGAVMESQGYAKNNSFSGVQRTGTEGLVGGMSLNQSLTESVSSASANQQQATEAFSKQLGQTFGETSSASETRSRQEALGRAVMSMHGDGAAAVRAAAVAHMQQHADSAESLEQVTGQKALSMMGGGSIGGSAGPLSGKVGVEGKISTTSGNARTSKEGSTDTHGFDNKAGYSEDFRASFANELAHKFADTKDKSWQSGLSLSDTTALNKTAQDTVTATETYSSLSQIAQGAGSATNLNYKDLGAAIANNPEAQNQLNQTMMYAPSDVRERANSLENQFRDTYKMSPSTARNAAQIASLAESRDIGNVHAAVGIAKTATGSGLGTNTDPHRNQSLTNDAPRFGSTKSAVGDLKGGEAARYVGRETQAMINSDVSASNLPTSSTIIEQDAKARTREVGDFANNYQDELAYKMRPQAEQRLQDAADQGTYMGAKVFGGAQGLIDGAKEHAKQQGMGLAAGLAVFALGANKVADGSAKDLFTGLEAADKAGGAAYSDYIAQHQDELGKILTESYQNRFNLTDAQARVFASNFSTNNIDKAEAEQALRQEARSPEEADNMIKVLGYASGDIAQAGSYLQHIQNLNSIDTPIAPTESVKPAGLSTGHEPVGIGASTYQDNQHLNNPSVPTANNQPSELVTRQESKKPTGSTYQDNPDSSKTEPQIPPPTNAQPMR